MLSADLRQKQVTKISAVLADLPTIGKSEGSNVWSFKRSIKRLTKRLGHLALLWPRPAGYLLYNTLQKDVTIFHVVISRRFVDQRRYVVLGHPINRILGIRHAALTVVQRLRLVPPADIFCRWVKSLAFGLELPTCLMCTCAYGQASVWTRWVSVTCMSRNGEYVATGICLQRTLYYEIILRASLARRTASSDTQGAVRTLIGVFFTTNYLQAQIRLHPLNSPPA